MPRGAKCIDLTDQRFGKLLVVKRAESQEVGTRGKHTKGLVYWHCVCDCGNKVIIAGASLRKSRKPTSSCGCLQKTVCSLKTRIRKYGAGSVDYDD